MALEEQLITVSLTNTFHKAYNFGDLFDSLMIQIFGFLQQLKPQGVFHVDFIRVVTVIGAFIVILGTLALVRVYTDWLADQERPTANILSSPAVSVDSAAISGRVPAGTSATSQVDTM